MKRRYGLHADEITKRDWRFLWLRKRTIVRPVTR